MAKENNTTTAKPWWKSKTLLANIAAIAADAATLYQSGGTVTAMAVANIALRVFTNSPLSTKAVN